MAAVDLFLEVEWHLAYHNETLRSALQKAGVTIEACLFSDKGGYDSYED